jgi:hypothetical protein
MKGQTGFTAETQTVGAFIVYRQAGGEIVHRHHVHVLPGATPPTEEDAIQEAHAMASRITGIPESETAVLRVTADELESSFGQRIDIQAQRLVGRSIPAR